MRRVGSERGFVIVALGFLGAFVLLFQLIDRAQDRQLASLRAPVAAPVRAIVAQPARTTTFHGAAIVVQLPAEASTHQTRRAARHRAHPHS
jgi:hypothetical protein